MKNILCAITQPHYLPWMGYFNLINRADIFVYLDDVKYIKREWKNRNKIRKSFSSDEFKWISIPIDKVNQNNYLNQCIVYEELNWRAEHVNQIYQVYRKTSYFDLYFEEISNIILNKNIKFLSEINIKLIEYFCFILDIKTKRIKSSSLNSNGYKENKLIDICKKINSSNYLANNKSSDYIDEDNFKKNNINLEYQDFNPIYYEQFYDNNKLSQIDYLSVVDLIFNQGKNSKKYIK